MLTSLNTCKKNLLTVEDLHKTYVLIETNFSSIAGEAEEILRSEIAMSVSALDTYIHDIFRVGMVEMFTKTRPTTKGYLDYEFSIKYLEIVSSQPVALQASVFNESIKALNSKNTFQTPKAIEYALSSIGISNIWTKISSSMSMSAQDIKDKLSLIIHRRNKIVHEFDFDIALGTRFPIDKVMAEDTRLFIEKLCTEISVFL